MQTLIFLKSVLERFCMTTNAFLVPTDLFEKDFFELSRTGRQGYFFTTCKSCSKKVPRAAQAAAVAHAPPAGPSGPRARPGAPACTDVQCSTLNFCFISYIFYRRQFHGLDHNPGKSHTFAGSQCRKFRKIFILSYLVTFETLCKHWI